MDKTNRFRDVLDELNPKIDEITIGEASGTLIQVSSSRDVRINPYFRADGSIFPRIQVPVVSPKSKSSDEQQDYLQNFSKNPWSWLLFSFPFHLYHYITTVKTEIAPTLLRKQSQFVNALAWHPQLQKFSIALRNDCIYLFDLVRNEWSGLRLEHQLQENINALAWKPMDANSLAVACDHGICIWRITRSLIGVNENFTVRRFKDKEADCQFLTYPGDKPVNSLTWSPDGRYLATSSFYSNQIVVWEPKISYPTPLVFSERGCSVVSWSPNGQYLFAGSVSDGLITIRVWETISWTSSSWDIKCGENESSAIQSVAWYSRDKSSYLIFCLVGSCTLHLYEFFHQETKPTASLVYKESFNSFIVNDLQACGTIKEISWDPTGSRLAITFVESSLIAILKTSFDSHVPFIPLSLQENGKPCIIQFCNQFPRGSLLSVVWENGVISMYPFYTK